jgi:hypothetical protein
MQENCCILKNAQNFIIIKGWDDATILQGIRTIHVDLSCSVRL